MSSTRAKIEQISDLNQLGSRIREFSTSSLGNLAYLNSRLNDLINEMLSVYNALESKRATIRRRLEIAQNSYQACLRHNTDKENKTHYENCDCELREVRHCEFLYQEISGYCENALQVIRDTENEKNILEGEISGFRSRITDAASSASSSLMSISGYAEDYVAVKANVDTLAMSERKSSNGSQSRSGESRPDESGKHVIEMLPSMETKYAISNLRLSSWILDLDEEKIVRVKKESDSSCLLSGFNSSSAERNQMLTDIELILKHNNINLISCWIRKDELEVYQKAGFHINKEKSSDSDGYVVNKNI